MAEVFLASAVGAEGFSRRVAIKRVLPGFSDNEAFAKMFVDEAQISSQLVHPNIVSVLDFDRDAEQRLFLVMELVEGKDLDALDATGLVPIPVVIFVVTEILRGLGFAHDLPVGTGMRGIVHRDVSPHNVLLSWEGAVKVSDFGIAKARAASEATASQLIKGKPAYMSPEQANGQALDGRSDLFAVGIMLWEMLVGRQLFVAEDTRGTLAAVLFGQIPRPRSLRAEVPKDLERVCMKLLERDLSARYATAEAAIAALLACADAPKNGRELLVATLAERFPSHARIRQSLARARAQPPVSSAEAPTLPMVSAEAHAAPAVAIPSLGAKRDAPTRIRPASPGKLIAILAVALVGSAAAAFGIAKLVRRTEPANVAAVTHDAGAIGEDAAPAVAAAADPLPDGPRSPAAEPPADAAKKDATPTQPAHPAEYGRLVVTAFPVVTVYVDNKRYGDTPIDIKQLAVGKHTIRLENDERKYKERIPITITENQTMTIDRTK